MARGDSGTGTGWWNDNRDRLRNHVRVHVQPHAGTFDAQRMIPDDVLSDMGELGMFGMSMPERYGGHGESIQAMGELHEFIGGVCSSLRSLLTVGAMTAQAILRWGRLDQRERWIPRLAAGESLAAFALTEAGGGTDQGNVNTTAVRSSKGWTISGVKTWVTGALAARLFLVFARVPDAGMAAFLVPRDAPGVVVVPAFDVLGLRAGMHGDLHLNDVTLPEDCLLGPERMCEATVMTWALSIGRLSVAYGCVGIVQASLAASTSYALGRDIGGTRLYDAQLVRRMLTDMITDARAARGLCKDAAVAADAGDPRSVMASMIAKYFASSAAAKATSGAVQMHGANGISTRFPVERLYRDSKVMEIIEGSTELQQITIADEAMREVSDEHYG